MIVKILRQENRNSKPYYQEFEYRKDTDKTVAYVLDYLNYEDDLFDIQQNPAKRIRWECSCQQKQCGACAMVINGKPALACDTFVKDLKGDKIVLEPLSKFPVISDLIVDRSIIFDNLVKAGLWFEEDEIKVNKKEYEHQYSAAKCLKCGLCLEVCPNYHKGEQFYGAVLANEAYLICSQSPHAKAETIKEYNKHFATHCSKSFSCENICPAKIPTIASISKMNRPKKL